LALSRCIPLAAASLHKPNHYFCPTNIASATTLFGVKLCRVIREAVHRLAVASPVRGASKLPPTPPWSGRIRSPLNPIDHAQTALRGVSAPWNPDHSMETKRAFAPLWKPTTNPMRIGCPPWYAPMEPKHEATSHPRGNSSPCEIEVVHLNLFPPKAFIFARR
jgi:hypothetical protein